MSSPSIDDQSDRRRFTVSEFLHMVEVGIFEHEDHVELVNGEVFVPSPQGPTDGSLKDELHGRLADAYCVEPVHILNRGPLRTGSFGLPEPDLAVVRGAPRDYLTEYPSGADTLLVVELALTSQKRDREKASDYARGQVPAYWLVDLEARRLDVYTDPDAERGEYRSRVSLRAEDSVSLPTLDETWTVSSLLV